MLCDQILFSDKLLILLHLPSFVWFSLLYSVYFLYVELNYATALHLGSCIPCNWLCWQTSSVPGVICIPQHFRSFSISRVYCWFVCVIALVMCCFMLFQDVFGHDDSCICFSSCHHSYQLGLPAQVIIIEKVVSDQVGVQSGLMKWIALSDFEIHGCASVRAF